MPGQTGLQGQEPWPDQEVSRKIRGHPKHGCTGPAEEAGEEEGSWRTRGVQ